MVQDLSMLSDHKKISHDFGLWSKMTPIGNEWEIDKNTPKLKKKI